MKKIIFFTLAFSVIGIQAGIDQQLVDGINQKNLDMVQQALNRGADINATDAQGNTALHNAVMQNDPEVVRMLLEKGANPNIKNHIYYEKIPCIFIKRFRINFINLIEIWELRKPILTIQKRVDMTGCGHESYILMGSKTPLMLTNNPEITKLLLKYNTDINAQDMRGNTALHLATILQNIEKVKFLLDNGASPTIKRFKKIEIKEIESDLKKPIKIAGKFYEPRTSIINKQTNEETPLMLAKVLKLTETDSGKQIIKLLENAEAKIKEKEIIKRIK